MSEWTESQIQQIQDILSCYPASRYGEARQDISKTFGRTISSAALRGLFQRQGLKSPTTYLSAEKPKTNTSANKQSVDKGRVHFVIGDTQIKPGVSTAHLGWIGQYLVDQFVGRDVCVAHLGDHWDMPSLSSYDKGKGSMENRRYRADIEAGNAGMSLLMAPLRKHNEAQRRARRPEWHPELHFFLGNHEERIARAVEDNIQLEGVIGYHNFNLRELGWKVHDYLKPVELDGISYSHFFYNPNTGRPYSGENLETRLKTLGRSFTMGHQQGLKVATRYVGERRHQGLVLGSTYLHDENYLGYQGNTYWRGIMVCHGVEHGQYDRMEVSLDWLCRKYEGVTLKTFMERL